MQGVAGLCPKFLLRWIEWVRSCSNLLFALVYRCESSVTAKSLLILKSMKLDICLLVSRERSVRILRGSLTRKYWTRRPRVSGACQKSFRLTLFLDYREASPVHTNYSSIQAPCMSLTNQHFTKHDLVTTFPQLWALPRICRLPCDWQPSRPNRVRISPPHSFL